MKEECMTDNPVGIIIITLVILFAIFMVMRELMCWYWKINEMISLLKDINEKLSKKIDVN